MLYIYFVYSHHHAECVDVGPVFFVRSAEVEDWSVQLLPSVQSVQSGSHSPQLLVLLRRMAAMDRQRFVSALQTHAASLLNAAAEGDTQWQRAVVELLFWPPDVTADAKAAFEKFLRAEGVNEAVKRYAREVLWEKYGPTIDVAAA